LTNALWYNFELQNDGTRKLTQCLEYVFSELSRRSYFPYIDYSTYGEDIISFKKLPLSSCNKNITIKTHI
jgi:hypothetical protein